MIHCMVWMSTALLAGMLVGAAWSQQDSGIPPMLETQRPLAHPSAPEKPKPVAETPISPTSRSNPKAAKGRAQVTKAKNRQASSASPKKVTKPGKKKGVTAKPRSRSADQRS